MKTHVITFRVNEETKTKLEKISKKEYRNASNMLVVLINERYNKVFSEDKGKVNE